MKLYNSNLAPSPRRVRIFLAEKGVSIPHVEVDLARLDHKTPEFSGLNPFETIPVLELDDGTRIAETIAICRYIEALWPEPNLFGLTALEQATIEELRAPLPFTLVAAQQRGFAQYHELAAAEQTISEVHRLNAVERIVRGIEQTVG